MSFKFQISNLPDGYEVRLRMNDSFADAHRSFNEEGEEAKLEEFLVLGSWFEEMQCEAQPRTRNQELRTD
ncbi:MAG: hypothetical protein ACK5JP_06485 [Akkermansiaceae bacterium]